MATQRASIAFVRWSAPSIGLAAACKKVDLSSRTIARWRRQRRIVRLRGRPPRRATPDQLQLATDLCAELGPSTSAPRLQALLPSVSKREIASIVARYRFEHLDTKSLIYVVRWHEPGRVWAMDFTQAPSPIDGIYPYILAVRDLASGKQLLSLPTADQSSETTCRAIEALFREHGAPLVLKSDNGSAFISEDLAICMAPWGVHLLLSPVRCPSYNGACEAGIGGLKTRAHHVAARNGRAGQWSCEDVEAARLLGNSVPRGPAQRSADERWSSRASISQWGRELLTDAIALHRSQGDTDRIATRKAMQDLGLTSFRRKRIALPFNPAFRAKNP